MMTDTLHVVEKYNYLQKNADGKKALFPPQSFGLVQGVN